MEIDLPKKYGYLSGVIFLGKLWLSRRDGCLRMDGCLGGVIFGKKIFEEWMDVWVGT